MSRVAGGKLRHPVGGVAVGADQHEHGQAKAKRFGIEQRHPGADHAAVLQCLHPAPDRIARQPDLFAKLFKRHACIALQQRKDAAVEVVEFLHGFERCGKIASM